MVRNYNRQRCEHNPSGSEAAQLLYFADFLSLISTFQRLACRIENRAASHFDQEQRRHPSTSQADHPLGNCKVYEQARRVHQRAHRRAGDYRRVNF